MSRPMSLQAPAKSAERRRHDSLASTWGEVLKGTIGAAILDQPRSRQTQIGPSEIGMACDHCLAAKLAGWDKREAGIPWLPFIGTAVHAELEKIFEAAHEADIAEGHNGLFQVEKRVNVGEILGQPIYGSTDLFIHNIGPEGSPGMTVDWKIVGANTLKKAGRNGPTAQYRVQAHAYARGWIRAGYDVAYVAIYYLPRNAMSMNDGYFWYEPYNEQVAIDALERAERIARNLQALETATGIPGRDKYITGLPRDADCWDCRKYADYQTDPATGQTDLGTALGLPTPTITTTPARPAPTGDLNTVLDIFPGSTTK